MKYIHFQSGASSHSGKLEFMFMIQIHTVLVFKMIFRGIIIVKTCEQDTGSSTITCILV